MNYRDDYDFRQKHDIPTHGLGNINPTPTPYSERISSPPGAVTPRLTLLARVADVNSELEVLHKRLRELKNRLAPVSVPIETELKGPSPRPLEGTSQLACELDALWGRAAVLNALVDDISDKLEV